MKPRRSFLIVLGAALLATTAGRLVAEPLGTAFTYQGSLSVGGSPGNGNYDLRFTLMDASSGGNVVAGPLTRSGVPVSDGFFSVSLDFASGVFDGEARWLAIEVRAGGVGAFTLLAPRQLLTPAPHALYAPRAEQASTATSAATAAVAAVANTVAANAVGSAGLQDGSVTAGKIANGQVVRSLNALRDNVTLAQGSNLTIAPSGQTLTLSSPADWHLAGNAGTTAGTEFLGTTDNQALELKVNGQRAWRLEPRGESPNIVGGHGSNLVDAAASGATIGGGGGFGTAANKVAASYGTIAGGLGNIIASNAESSSVGGGSQNALGPGADHGTIAGGSGNSVQAGASNGAIVGGAGNSIQGGAHQGTIAGGSGNLIETGAHDATIGGGQLNKVRASAAYATVPGGQLNEALGAYSLAAGRRAKANHGSFVWADSTDADFIHSGSNQFAVRAHGGVWFQTGPAGVTLDGPLSMNGPLSGATLAAEQLTGTLPDARLSANVARRDQSNAFTGDQTVGGSLTATAFQGNGAGVTGLDAGHLASGTVADTRLSANVARRDQPNTFTGDQIVTGGNVGIGATSPQAKLDVDGALLVRRDRIRLEGPDLVIADATRGDGGLALVHEGDGAEERLVVNYGSTFTNGTRIDGNLGIGTNPQVRLDVDGDLTVRGDRIRLEGSDLVMVDAARGDGGRALVHDGDGTEERLVVNYGNDFANGTRIDGNLGIGTNPQAKLDVAGEVSISGFNTTFSDSLVDVVQTGVGYALNVEVAGESAGSAMPALRVQYAPDAPGGRYVGHYCCAIGAHSNDPDLPGGVRASAFDTDASNGLDGVGVQGMFIFPGTLLDNVGRLGTPACGVKGEQNQTTGIGAGVYGVSTVEDGNGVMGMANNGTTAFGVYGRSTSGYAGYFEGKVYVNGTLDALDKKFQIDHPVDPENKYLSHASVESSEMKTFYDGVVTTDARGYATVELPAWFEALNGDFRYQLTVVDEEEGEDWVLAKVTQEIADNRFTIRTSAPGAKVCWQVSGVRRDAWAQAHPLEVEQDKPEAERGLYLAPAEHGQPEEKGIDHARKPKAPQPA